MERLDKLVRLQKQRLEKLVFGSREEYVAWANEEKLVSTMQVS